MSGQDTIYQMMSDRIIEQLEKGVAPWRKPWRIAGGGWPLNIKSKKAYRGVNPIVLAMEGYSSPWWGTYDQMAEKAGMVKVPAKTRRGYHWVSPDGTPRGVRQGERHTVVVFWKQIFVEERDPETGKPVKKRIPMLRFYRVFSAEQVDGLLEKYYPAPSERVEPDLALKRGQEVFDGYIGRADAPRFFEGGDKAYYTCDGRDEIHVPPRAAYPDEREYYSTAFHESAHSTGAKKRLHRPGIENFDHFGSGQYAKEELVAEIGAAFLMATAGIESEGTFENSAAYVGNWLGKLRGDHKLVVQAAAQAQHAADYILGVTYEDEEHEESSATCP